MDSAGKVVVALIVAVAAGYVGWRWLGGEREGGEARRYFYDLSEARLYEAPRDAFAPLEGIGGEPGDGVEAVVIACPEDPEATRTIAYLLTHTEEYKAKHDQKATTGGIEGITRDWISDNTLLREADGDTWHKASTREGAEIRMSAKRRCPNHDDQWMKSVLP